MSLRDLQIGGLYVLLFIRHDPPMPNNFHWALYLHTDLDRGGTKYHIRQQGSGWLSSYEPSAGVLKSFLLVGLYQIATVPVRLADHVDGVMRSFDNALNTPGITCRVWVLWVLGLLHKPLLSDGYVILKCADLKALEEEIMAWGNKHAAGAAQNSQPRPVGQSEMCQL